MVQLDEKEKKRLIDESISKFDDFKPILIGNNNELIIDLLFKNNEFKNGIVYQFCKKDKVKFTPVYIGKSKGKYFKTRLKAHLCNIGEGTQSKNHKIIKEKEIYLRFIETNPDSLRNLIEEELIDKYKDEKFDLWNFKKLNQ